MDGLVFMVVLIGIPWVIAWAYRGNLNHKRFMKVIELKAEMNSRLLDRVGTDPAALEFLKSDAQQQMFDVKLSEPVSRMPAPYGRMLTALQIGMMLLSAGVALLSIRSYFYSGDQKGFLVLGTVATALGVGSIMSAVVTYLAGKYLFPATEGRG